MTEERTALVAPPEIPSSVRDAWLERGWPEALLERAYALRVRNADVERWLKRGKSAVRRIQRDLNRREQFQLGTMRIREATWEDDEALADLYANAPESVGDEEVTVERSPFPFAQFRLQENVSILLAEDRGIVLAAIAFSGRKTLVAGQPATVGIMSAWRARKEARGHAIGRALQQRTQALWARPDRTSYYYRRRRRKGGVFAKVRCYTARPFAGDGAGIRPVREDDLPRCVELINRTHAGLDLFRPYTGEFLRSRLDDPFWGPKPAFWVEVYTWSDYYVLEQDGDVVACAGLWDRGRHLREVWQRGDARRVVENAALMDFGHAAGRDDAMATLVAYLVGKTAELGRGALMAPLQYAAEVVERLAGFACTEETRPFYWQPSAELRKQGVKVTRPYTDLAYW